MNTDHDLKRVIEMLTEALWNPTRRPELLREFREAIARIDSTTPTWEALRDLAWNCSFYEADEARRKEDPSYFGDDVLTREIEKVLETVSRL